MSKKKYFLIMLILIISICTISAASAADSVADTIASDGTTDMVANNNNIATEPNDKAADTIASDNNANIATNDNNIATEPNDKAADTIASDETNDIENINGKPITASADEKTAEKKLGANNGNALIDEAKETSSYSFVHYYDYSVNVTQVNEISTTNGGTIYLIIDPCKDKDRYAFDFYISVYKGAKGNSFDNLLFRTERFKSGSSDARDAKIYTYKFKGGLFTPGTYFLVVENYIDDKPMAIGAVAVGGNAVINAENFNGYYKSDSKMVISIKDKKTGNGIANTALKLVFKKGKTTKTKTYTTTQSGYLRFKPPVGAGTWTVTISSNYDHIKASSIKRTVVIKKPSVALTVYKNTEYLSYKSTLKATVKALGKKVNEGTVTFKINGKTYKVAVKNGVATKKIKLPKAKTYTYSAKFTGNNYKTKTKSNKAVVKKQIATKISIKNQKIDYDKMKFVYFKVLTSDGKKVQSGKTKIQGVTTEFTNGECSALVFGFGDSHLKKAGALYKTYKKTITKTYTVKFIPTSHKYKASSKKVKVTSTFKCFCGKRYTHTHYYSGTYGGFGITTYVV